MTKLTNSDSFRHFCEVAQAIAETRSTNDKISLCANYFRDLTDPKSVKIAARFLGEGAFSTVSGLRASVGHRTISVSASEFLEIDYELVFRACRQATGSASEAIEKLMDNIPVAVAKRSPNYPDLQTVQDWYQHLASLKSMDEKKRYVQEIWQQLTALEIKYFIRILSQGSLRIGFESRSIVTALAQAFGAPQETVRHAHMLTGSLEETAFMCQQNTLHQAEFQLFQPVAFMLASPAEIDQIDELTSYVVEEKFDGMRCQLHIQKENVQLFSRDLHDISTSFPEITRFFQEKCLSATVLDGEICVYTNESIRPFLELQKRMGVKKPTKKLQQTYPVIFIAYDVLFLDKKPLFSFPLQKRRKLLEELCKEHQIALAKQTEVEHSSALKRAFATARDCGNEGLMLKKKDSLYEYGQRRKTWLKLKEPAGSLDTVIMYAHAGTGKRGGMYSDFTLGIRVADDDRYEEEFIPIGKSYGGYTNEELKKLNQKIKLLAVEKFGPTLSIKPGIVVEIEFDDIQSNSRTKAGYTLRLPRFKAIRWDLAPEDCDTLQDVERMVQQKLNAKKSQESNQGFTWSGDNTKIPDVL